MRRDLLIRVGEIGLSGGRWLCKNTILCERRCRVASPAKTDVRSHLPPSPEGE